MEKLSYMSMRYWPGIEKSVVLSPLHDSFSPLQEEVEWSTFDLENIVGGRGREFETVKV